MFCCQISIVLFIMRVWWCVLKSRKNLFATPKEVRITHNNIFTPENLNWAFNTQCYCVILTVVPLEISCPVVGHIHCFKTRSHQGRKFSIKKIGEVPTEVKQKLIFFLERISVRRFSPSFHLFAELQLSELYFRDRKTNTLMLNWQSKHASTLG